MPTDTPEERSSSDTKGEHESTRMGADLSTKQVRCGQSSCSRGLVRYTGSFLMSLVLVIFSAYMLARESDKDTSAYLALLSSTVAVWVPSPNQQASGRQ